MQYNQNYTFAFDVAPTVTKVALTRLAAVTHSFDLDQRYVPLSFTVDQSSDPPHVTVTAPLNGGIAPRGWYMLWIMTLDSSTGYRVPCQKAHYVKVGA